jgi:hypothetical protein
MKSTKKNLSQSHPGYSCELHQCQQQTSIRHLTITFGYPEENYNLQATAEIYPANMGMFLETASALQDQDLLKEPSPQMNYHSNYLKVIQDDWYCTILLSITT